MISALIFAGGTGQRMNTRTKPKQFLELHGKPIILYTLEHFEEHPDIDSIVIVCIEDWVRDLRRIIEHYSFSKISQIVNGDNRGADKSIYNGLQAMNEVCGDEDIVLIHDGVRPLIDSDIISANIAKAKECGTAITVEPVVESVVRLDEKGLIIENPPRHEMYSAKAPQSFRFGLIWDLYKRANNDGQRTIDSSHLCSLYGVTLHTVMSSENNLKITKPADYYIFRALYEAMENKQILGC